MGTDGERLADAASVSALHVDKEIHGANPPSDSVAEAWRNSAAQAAERAADLLEGGE